MDLKQAIESRAHTFNSFWKQYLVQGIPAPLYDAARHLPESGGKRLRPVLAMIACETIGGSPNHVLPFAAALELMHNFTLVHDDIMDKAHLRRNVPTVHTKYGEPTAILAGDFLFAKSFQAMHDLNVTPKIFKELDSGLIQCIIDICEGQQLDMEFEQAKTISEKEYLTMIQKKTAVLFRLATRGGGIIGGGTPEETNGLTAYGEHLGLAFQIWDDYLDISSDEGTLGKDIGNDIRNGKKTLIAVHAHENANEQQQNILTTSFGNSEATDNDVQIILKLFRDIGSIDYAKTKAQQLSALAIEDLATVQDSPAKTLLIDIATYAISREK